MRKIVFWLSAAALLITAACQQGDEAESLPLEACETPCGFRDSLGFHGACGYEGTDKGYLQVANERIWVEVEGKGPPLVLVHAGPLFDHRLFHPYLSRLKDHYQLIYLDMPGRYMSIYQKGDNYGIGKDVAVLEEVRKAFGYDKWSMLGHSFGGLTGLTYAKEYPENLKALYVTALGLNVDSELMDSVRKKLKKQYFQDVETKAENLQVQKQVAFHQDPGQYKLQHFDSAFYAYGSYAHFGPLSQNYRSSLDSFWKARPYDPDSASFYKGINVKTTVLIGAEDVQGFPEQTRETVQKMPNGHVVLFRESGHFPFIEEPKKFVKVLTSDN